MPSAHAAPQWIWSPTETDNQYVLFAKALPGPRPHGVPPATPASLRVRITASHIYELYLNGRFVARGPVPSDPAWIQYDDLQVDWPVGEERVVLAIVVHHARGTNIACQMPSRGGLLVQVEGDGLRAHSDRTWRCLDLPMWRQGVGARGWALGYCEDYDARREPNGWADKRWSDRQMASWPRAVAVPDAERIWGGYSERSTPMLRREHVAPVAFRAWQAPSPGAEDVADVSEYDDTEPLHPAGDWQPFSSEALNAALATANAFTLDLGEERVGHYECALEAPSGVVLELSGAELLRDGRPWIYRKGTRYSVRYATRRGAQRFHSFSWSGFRYLHVVLRGASASQVRFERVGCLEKRAPLTPKRRFETDDPLLRRIFDICQHTLAIGAQEHLIDCPTREQAQYWGDAVFIAESLWVGFGEPSYLQWYLECFLHVPFEGNAQIRCIYPGVHTTLLDYSLIPLLGQRLYKAHRGVYYRPAETFAKAMRLKEWYDARLDGRGLVTFDYQAYAEAGLRNFVDHPGIGWHNFPHPGIDRDGTSCPLNTFYYGYLRTLADIAEDLGVPERTALSEQADRLGLAIVETFYDGAVFHDAERDGVLSEGTSWQTNGLAVYMGLLRGEPATDAIRAMLSGYDRLCRCSPYFHFYFLPALRAAGLRREALELLAREWGPMVEAGATTTWESFSGDDKDSLCHPWSTAPFLYLLT